MSLNEITPLILTFNEAPNIHRTLQALNWAKRILVLDSGSTDETIAITKEFQNAQVLFRPFDSFASQCNFGLTQITTPWVLSLDADYVLTPEFTQEIESVILAKDVPGYSACFRYCIYGRPLRASLYPPRVVLYRRDAAKYLDVGHGHRVQINGPIRSLESFILHDDRKPLDRWFSEQIRYSKIEADHLVGTSNSKLDFADRIRKNIIIAPIAVPLYTLLAKGMILEGWPGFFYTAQRTIFEMLLSLRLLDLKLRAR